MYEFGMIFLTLIFFAGFLVGRKTNGTSASKLHSIRLQGQAEVRNYLVEWLKSQSATIPKKEILKLMGVTAAAQHNHQLTTSPLVDTSTTIAPSKVNSVTQNTIEKDASIANKEYEQFKKEKHELQNINTILYVASFLLVAAAVLFIGANVDDTIKFIGAWSVALGFYIAGMVLHTRSQRLRPAATAFIGTGLALIPFAGIATNQFVLHDPKLSWLLTSMIGLGLFLWATFQLQSQLLAYLTLAFVFSLTVSSVSVLQLGFVWYFVTIIIVTSLLNISAILFPEYAKKLFSEPVDQTAQIAVPLAVFGSWLTASQLPAWQHGMILLVTTIHYCVSALRPYKPSYRQLYIFIVRWTAMGAVLAFVYDAFSVWHDIGITLLLLAFAQIIMSLIIINFRKTTSQYEYAWLWIGLGLQILSLMFLFQGDASLRTMALVSIIISSLFLSLYRREASFGYVAVFTFPILVYQVGIEQISPNLSQETYSIIFLLSAAVGLGLRHILKSSRQYSFLSTTAYSLYTTLMVMSSIGLSYGWMSSIVAIAAMYALIASYIEKQKSITILVIALGYISSFQGAHLFSKDIDSIYIITAWIAGAVFYLARIYLAYLKDQDRAQMFGVGSMAILSVTSFLLLWVDAQEVQAAVMMIAVSALFFVEARVYKQHEYNEIAVIGMTLALQRLTATQLTIDIHFAWYIAWWSLTFYALGWWRRYRNESLSTRFWTFSAIGVALFFSLNYIAYDEYVWWFTLLAGIASVMMVIEAHKQKIYFLNEVALITITVILQRLVASSANLDSLFYTHWWALVLAGIAFGRRYIKEQKDTATGWWIGALCMMSIPSGLTALGQGGSYQLLFLIEHAGLLVGAAAYNHRLSMGWGAAGVALAVLYWLQGYSYALVGLLGLGLIGFAIARLLRNK